jgi:inorganic pyrophosphatase
VFNTNRKGLMPDFNIVLAPGDIDNGIVNTVVEIPQGSRLKVEWDRQRAAFMLDRVEPAIFAKPCNYGFIPQTLDEDGDELDTLIVCPEPLATGVWLEAKIIGLMKFIDDGEVDDKIVVVPMDNRDDDRVQSLGDMPQLVKQLEHHFTHYKDLKKPGKTIVSGWGDVDEAKQVIRDCIERWSSQK